MAQFTATPAGMMVVTPSLRSTESSSLSGNGDTPW